MNYRNIKIIIGLAIPVFVIVKLSCCRGINAPAPLGIHGEYSLTSNVPIYKTNNINKDSVLKILSKENLNIKTGKFNDYGAPWDSLRYLIGNIPCDKQLIEAYIEFKDKRATNTTFKVLWFNATPTKDDKIYQKLTDSYYKCFESFLRKHNAIK